MQDSETLEIVDLESLLSDELHCESPHTTIWGEDGGCSVSVTHLATRTCGNVQRICSNRAEYLSRWNPVWRSRGTRCHYCGSTDCTVEVTAFG
jgi:hypothetical protein